MEQIPARLKHRLLARVVAGLVPASSIPLVRAFTFEVAGTSPG